MDKLTRDIFNDICGGLAIDQQLCQRINQYMNRFITKTPDHAAFFGGNLTGVYVVKFTQADRLTWFDEILQVDEEELAPRLNKLINPRFYIVAGDVFNLSCVWLSHAIYRNAKLSDKLKHDTMLAIYMILQFRFITSRLNRHWVYPCSKEIAEATLMAMSNKYAIKQKGSWIKVITDRSEDIIDMKHSIHRKTIERMEHDIRNKGESVGYLLTDTQGRNKDLLKNIYALQKQIQESGAKVNATSATFIELDGDAVLKDKDNALENYRNYIMSIIGDKHSFIKIDLLTVIESSNKTMPAPLFRNTLSWICDQYAKNKIMKTKIDGLINDLMTHLFTTLSQNRNIMRNKTDVAGLISKMKGIYTASRTSNDLLLNLRLDIEKIVLDATKCAKGPHVAAVRTGIMLYIILRTFTKQRYS